MLSDDGWCLDWPSFCSSVATSGAFIVTIDFILIGAFSFPLFCLAFNIFVFVLKKKQTLRKQSLSTYQSHPALSTNEGRA